jgi:hypothetical protein
VVEFKSMAAGSCGAFETERVSSACRWVKVLLVYWIVFPFHFYFVCYHTCNVLSPFCFRSSLILHVQVLSNSCWYFDQRIVLVLANYRHYILWCLQTNLCLLLFVSAVTLLHVSLLFIVLTLIVAIIKSGRQNSMGSGNSLWLLLGFYTSGCFRTVAL